jgi:PAS domain-containing protein
MGDYAVYILDGCSPQDDRHLVTITSRIVVDANPRMARMTSYTVACEQRKPAIDLNQQR